MTYRASKMGSASPKRILVTGGTGLMGMGIRHMVETTEKRDDEVWFFLSPEETNLTWVSIVVMFENVAWWCRCSLVEVKMIETMLCLASTTFKCIFVNVLKKYILLVSLEVQLTQSQRRDGNGFVAGRWQVITWTSDIENQKLSWWQLSRHCLPRRLS